MATLPAWSKAELRPSRRARAARVVSPSVRAATAGPNTSPTIAIAALASVTGQNSGKTNSVAAPSASTASAATIAPRLAQVASIAPPIGVCTTMPSRPAIVVIRPTADCVQWRSLTR